MFDERLLHGTESVSSGQPFDGRDLRVMGTVGEDQARRDGFAVHEDGAGSAVSFVATLLGSGQLRLVAEAVQQ